MVIQESITLRTKGRGFTELSDRIQSVVQQASVATGVCHLFLQHTSASLILCENADPSVRRDLEQFFSHLVTDGDPRFSHSAEGPDDMPAHIRAILTQNDMSIPITNNRLVLGTWQGIYLWEHRTTPHQRRLTITIYG
jgi:secondary thiamine-phosphate synthase enzyme